MKYIIRPLWWVAVRAFSLWLWCLYNLWVLVWHLQPERMKDPWIFHGGVKWNLVNSAGWLACTWFLAAYGRDNMSVVVLVGMALCFLLMIGSFVQED